MLICNSCGYPNMDGSRFCENCGAKLLEETPRQPQNNSIGVCVNCGAPIEPGDIFCENCGWRHGDEIPVPITEADIRKWNNIPEEPVEQKKKVNILIPVVIGVSAVLIVGILAVFFLVVKPMILDKSSETSTQYSDLSDEELEDILSGQGESDVTPIPTATPMPTEKPFDPNAVTFSFVDSSTVNFAEYRRVGIASASETSEYVQEGSTNGADMAVDGNEITSWQEGVAGDGIGQGVSYQFDRQYNIKYFSFKLGNWRNDKYYYGNNKPKSLTVTMGGRAFVFDFPSDRQEFFITLSEDFPANGVSISINSVYKGTSWADTCIAEIGIYGR